MLTRMLSARTKAEQAQEVARKAAADAEIAMSTARQYSPANTQPGTKMPRLHRDTCCRIQVVSTCRRLRVSCIGDKTVRQFVARLLLDTKGYKSTVT